MSYRSILWLYLLCILTLCLLSNCNSKEENCTEIECPALSGTYLSWIDHQVGDTLLYENEFGDQITYIVVEIAQTGPYPCSVCSGSPECCFQFGGMRAYAPAFNYLMDVELRSIGQAPPPPWVTYSIFTLDDNFEDVVFYSHRHSWDPLRVLGANQLLDTFIVDGKAYDNVLFSQIDTSGTARLTIEPWQMWVHLGAGVVQFKDRQTNRTWQLQDL